METVLAMYGWMHDVCSWISKILEFGIGEDYSIACFSDGGDMSNI